MGGKYTVQGKAIFGLKVIHTLCPLVKTPCQWVSASAGAKAEKEKGLSCTWGSRVTILKVDIKVLYPHLFLFHGHCCSQGRSFSSVAILSNEGKHVHILFYPHAWLWKLYQSKSWLREQITHACLKDRKNSSNPITNIARHKVSSGDLPKSLQTLTSPGKLNPNTFLVNQSWINSCLWLLPLRNVYRQISTSSDILIIQNYFQIGLQNTFQVQSLWGFCNRTVVIRTFLAE